MATPSLVASGCLEAVREGVVVHIHVQPRASRTSFAGLHGGAIKLRITAPPVDGKANALIAEVLAQTLRVPKAAVSLVGGQQSRHKRFRVEGVDVATAEERLAAVLSSAG